MLCYHDKTFCDSDCKADSCYRFLSKSDRDKANELQLPIALSDFSKVCKDYRE